MVSKKDKRAKKKIFSFRLTKEEAQEYDKMCFTVGLSRTELLKQIMNKNTNGEVVKIKHKKRKIIECKKDHEKLLYFFNKTSNNINQLAKKINIAFAQEIINENLMISGIHHLKSIEEILYELAKMPKSEVKHKWH